MSVAVAAASESIETLIYSSFEEHQEQASSDEEDHVFQVRKASQNIGSLHPTIGSQEHNIRSSIASAEKIREQIATHIISTFGGIDNVSNHEEEFVHEIEETLKKIVRVTLANVVTFRQSSLSTFNSFKSSDLYEATYQILDMVASFAFAKGDGRLAGKVVELLESFSNVELECIRGIVCQFLTMALHHLFALTNSGRQAKSASVKLAVIFGTNDDGEEFAWREEIISVIKPVIIQRLLDKSQAVRLLAIQAAGQIFRTLDSDDDDSLGLSNVELHEDIIQALLWNLSHDPSFANRSATIQSLPITIETLPAIVSRTGDSKLKVRVDALDVLCKKVNVKTLTRNQRIEILQNGLGTARYPATYQAVTKMLCCGWMKSVKFDPIKLLELLEATGREENDESREVYEDISVKAARAILAAASDEFQVFSNSIQSSSDIKTGNNSSSETMRDLGMITSDITLADLSAPEVRAYKENVLNWKRFNLGNICKDVVDQNDGDDDYVSDSLSPSLVLFARTLCDAITESTKLAADKKSSLLSEIVPDVTVLGEAIEKHMNRLNEILIHMEQIDEEQEPGQMAACEDEEDKEVFICLNLLKMSKVVDMNEEGTRRCFSNIIHRILCSPSTHADVIEGAVIALSESYDNEASFLLAISDIVSNIIETEMTDSGAYKSPDARKEQYLRGIEILSVALEKTSRKMSSNPILLNFSSTILTAVTDISLGPLVREAGVSCLGRFVILLDESTIIDTYKPILMEIAFGEEEKIEIRAQATLALCDLALLFPRIMAPITLGNVSDEEVSFSALLLQMMSQAKKSLALVAAECAAKLHFTGKMHDARIVATLIVMYFDKNFVESTNINDCSAKDVGSPTRLLQLLTVFFPAYSISCDIGRETLKAAFKPLLSIVNERSNVKVKGRKNVTWPIAKMIEYVCETLEHGYDTTEDNCEGMSESMSKDESSILAAVMAICSFINEEGDEISTSFLRALCKILSKSYIDVESENMKSLKLLKQGLEEMAMNVTDETAINYVETLIEILDEVKSDIDDEEEKSTVTDAESIVGERKCENDFEKESTTDAALSPCDDSRKSSLRSRLSNGSSIPTFASLGARDKNEERRRSFRSSRQSQSGIPLFASIGTSEAKSLKQHSDPDSDSSDDSSSSYESSDDSDF
jgi:condensin complex subunit 3